MNKMKYISPILYLIIFTSLCCGQKYYPLEIGNRWDYVRMNWGETEKDTFSVIVIADTIMTNGIKYYKLSKDFGAGKYVRVDTNYVYYFDETDSTDTPIYNFHATIDNWYKIGMFTNSSSSDSPRVQLSFKDSTAIFGIKTNVLIYDLDWLVPFQLNLSDQFGPIQHFTAHHDPYTTKLIGCKISGKTYGQLTNIDEEESLPTTFHLFQNYPNPFNPSTTIEFSIKKDTRTRLIIYNALGQLITTILDKELLKGYHNIIFDGSNYSSGVYFYQLITDDYKSTKKFVLMK